MRLLSNVMSLAALQAANFILPLVTLPYLVRVLGIEQYGLVVFAQGVVMYFNILVDYGFNLSATREISVNRGDSSKTSAIFNSVMLIKFALILLSLVILAILLLTIDKLNAQWELYVLTFGLIIGNAIFPVWFYQGMERMKYITLINVSMKILFTLAIFVFVQGPDDYYMVPLLNSTGFILAGVFALVFAIKKFGIKLAFPPLAQAKQLFKDSTLFFSSRIANEGGTHYMTVLLGSVFGVAVVGYYDIAQKLFKAYTSLFSVLTTALYPYMSKNHDIKLFKKILGAVILGNIVLVLGFLAFGEQIIEFVFNLREQLVNDILKISIVAAFVAGINMMIGYPLLAAYGHIKEANTTLIAASIIYIAAATLLALTGNVLWVIGTLILYEALGVLFRMYYVQRYQLLSVKS
jgi:PST family polysaccharide transporter